MITELKVVIYSLLSNVSLKISIRAVQVPV